MKTLAIVIPVWQRPGLTRHCLRWYRGLGIPGAETRVLAVGSEGDVSARLAADAGCEYFDTSNELLDRKYDRGLRHAGRFNPDAVALVGSDDFLSADYFDWALRQLAGGADLVGVLDFHMVDVARRRVLHWPGYAGPRAGEPIGAGRVFSQRILDRVAWHPHRGRDGHAGYVRDDERCLERIRAAGGRIRVARVADVGCRYWAVKTGEEMNPVSAFENAWTVQDVTRTAWPRFASDLPDVAHRDGIHPSANVYDSTIGKGTRIAAFAEVGGATVGERCKIEAHAFVCPGVTLGDEVFVGPGVRFTNDRYPRAVGDWTLERTWVRRGASLGAGAVILPGVTIGAQAIVGAGSVVTADVAAGAVVRGNPAC